MVEKSFIKINNLSKNYGNLQVIKDLNLDVEENEIITIIGSSGCGKTTFLKIVAGLIDSFEGKVIINKKSPKEAIKNNEIGIMFQNPVLLPWRSALTNIKLPLEIEEKKDGEKTDKLLSLMGLSQFKEYLPNELSGGMKQRIALARTLVYEPSILLMDEPFASLDEKTRESLNLDLLKIVANKKIKINTIIFITHSISEAVFLSDRVVVLSNKPARVKKIIKIDLPKPRDVSVRNSEKYFEYIKCIRKLLED
jgi:NitT/TauT family transport system ATP-binding protein